MNFLDFWCILYIDDTNTLSALSSSENQEILVDNVKCHLSIFLLFMSIGIERFCILLSECFIVALLL